MTIKKKFAVLVGVMVAGFVALGAITYRTVDKVKVNGPLYANIITGKDLVADILPPPEYIIESYLTTMQLVGTTNTAEREALEKKLAQLHKDYDDRQEYWQKNLESGEIKTLITQASADPAHTFYTLVEGKLIPLVREGKKDEAAALMNGDVQAAYAQHRAAIDKLVVLATEFSAKAEAEAASELTTGGRLLGGLAVGVTAFLVVISVVLARGVIKGLKTLETRLKDVAQGEGDLTKRVEISSRDEIGMVAHWFNLFIETVERVVAEVKTGAAQIDAGGAQIASASQSMAQGASEQASSLQQISASIEEMSGQTQQSAENAPGERARAGEQDGGRPRSA
ncbi:MAG: methyl-accepting chemotaxis protein [Phycisphaerales bacterium]